MGKISLPKKGDVAPRVLFGDVFEQLDRIPKNSIDCIVTSPPYWQQRDYGVEGQIGAEEDYRDYVETMVEVGDKLKAVLGDDGSYFLNIGDKFQDKNLKMIPSRVAIGMQEHGWVLRNFIVWKKKGHMPTSVEDRLNTIWEPIFFFVKGTGKYTTPQYNFYLDRIRVPHKTEENYEYSIKEMLSEEEYEKLPERIKEGDNLPRAISKEEYKKLPERLKKKENGDYEGKFKNAERKNLGASPGARISVQGLYYSGSHRKHEPNELEIIKYLREQKEKKGLTISDIAERTGTKKTTVEHWFRTDRGGRCLPNPEDWTELKKAMNFDGKYDKKMTETHYTLQDVGRHPNGRNPGDVWEMPTGTLPEAHFSIFPEELPRRVIKAACPPNGIVLDPFAGSGTVGEVAKELGRRSILIDLKKDYLDIMEKRCGKVKEV